jgi:hypothetical protein
MTFPLRRNAGGKVQILPAQPGPGLIMEGKPVNPCGNRPPGSLAFGKIARNG